MPAAVFPAIIFPAIFFNDYGNLIELNDPKIYGAVVAIVIGYLSRNIIATIFSVLGGILGYFIGAFFFDIGMQIMSIYGYEDRLINLKNN